MQGEICECRGKYVNAGGNMSGKQVDAGENRRSWGENRWIEGKTGECSKTRGYRGK